MKAAEFLKRESELAAALPPKSGKKLDLSGIDYSIAGVSQVRILGGEFREVPEEFLIPSVTKQGAVASSSVGAPLFLELKGDSKTKLILDFGTAGRLAASLIISCPKDSKAEVSLEISGSPEAGFLRVAFFAAKNSSLEVREVCDLSKDASLLSETTFSCEAGARAKTFRAILGGKVVSERRLLFLNGRNSDCDYSDVFYLDGNETLDTEVLMRHRTKETSGRVLSRGIMSRGGRCLFDGLVKIDKAAQKTDSFLAQHSLLLDSDSESDSVPSLEIEANDVKASHSASSGPIDEEQIFYLTARGIDARTAKRMIALGFIVPSMRQIPTEMRERIEKRVEEKWNASGGGNL